MMNSMSRRVGRQVLKEQAPFLKQGAASEVTIALCRLAAVRAESLQLLHGQCASGSIHLRSNDDGIENRIMPEMTACPSHYRLPQRKIRHTI